MEGEPSANENDATLPIDVPAREGLPAASNSAGLEDEEPGEVAERRVVGEVHSRVSVVAHAPLDPGVEGELGSSKVGMSWCAVTDASNGADRARMSDGCS